MRRACLAAMILVACAGPAAAQSTCRDGLHAVITAQLFFGRAIDANSSVSDADWRAFLDTEVTPRFPDGLSVFDARGQWRDPSGVLSREPSKVLLLVLEGKPDEPTKLAAVAQAYKTHFHQQSVLIVESQACAAF